MRTSQEKEKAKTFIKDYMNSFYGITDINTDKTMFSWTVPQLQKELTDFLCAVKKQWRKEDEVEGEAEVELRSWCIEQAFKMGGDVIKDAKNIYQFVKK